MGDAHRGIGLVDVLTAFFAGTVSVDAQIIIHHLDFIVIVQLGDDVDRLWQRDELCTSDDAVFVATGVCDGWLPGPVVGKSGTVTTSRVISVADSRDEIIRHEHAPAS